MTTEQSKKTIPCPIHTMANTQPDAIAITDGETSISYQALDLRIQERCNNPRLSQLPQGRKVALSVAKDSQSTITTFSLFRLGIITLFLNPNYSEQERKTLLNRAKCTEDFHANELITDDSTGHSERDATDTQNTTEISFSAPLTILCSSGSTGAPKLLIHSAQNYLSSATASQSRLPLTIGDTWGLSLPLYHVSGLSILWRCFQAGATLVIPPKSLASSRDQVAYLSRHCSHLSLVPTQLQDLLDDGCSQHRLKHLIVGGAASSIELLQRAKDQGLPVQASYGLSEFSSQVCTQSLHQESIESLGSPLLPGSVKTSDSGQISLRGEPLFLGYLQDDGSIDMARDSEGWFHTQDSGTLKDSGLVLGGRLDRCFISGGENIDPQEIETQLLAHPLVKAAHVIPMPDSRFGDVPVAIIIPKAETLTESELRAFLKERLVSYKQPKDYQILDTNISLPEKPSLKRLKTLTQCDD